MTDPEFCDRCEEETTYLTWYRREGFGGEYLCQECLAEMTSEDEDLEDEKEEIK